MPLPVEFRVYAGRTDGHGLFVRVLVFSARRTMLDTIRAELRTAGLPWKISNDTLAFTECSKRTQYASHGHGRTLPRFATIYFHRARLGTEVITHEFTHALLTYAERMKVMDLMEDRKEWVDELLAYAMGRMCSRFVRRATRLGLYKEE